MSGISALPNILVLYDNSTSMDNGGVKGGDDPNTNSNIARRALNTILKNYHTQFNWGIETFDTYGEAGCSGNNGLCGLFRQYQGTTTSMVFTNDCVNGVSSSNSGLPCIPNPEPNGYNYLTYGPGGYLLVLNYNKNFAWGVYYSGDPSGFWLDLFDHHATNSTTWNITNDNSTVTNPPIDDFSNPFFGSNPIGFGGCVDAGSGGCNISTNLPHNLFMKTGWLFLQNFSGAGKIVEAIKPDAVAGHYTNMINALAPELPNPSSSDIKNGASQTPLVGSFLTAQKYFSGTLPGYSSPIQDACQKNYILTATDGQPTADASGNNYNASDLSNATTGRAYTDLYSQIQSLRNLSFNGKTYDVQTYVLGIGGVTSDSVGAAGLNKMAQYGGTSQALVGNNATSMLNSFQAIVDDIQYKIPITQSNGHIAISNTVQSQPTNVYKTFYATAGNMWQGNLIKSTPTISIANDIITYNTGTTNNFTNGAAAWLTSNTISGQSRQIITAIRQTSGGLLSGSPFEWANLSTYSQGLLLNSGETSTTGSQRLSYIRGDRSNEISASNPNGFRKRLTTVLGDIVNSSPVYVGATSAGYSESDFALGTPSFLTYAKNTASRRAMIYVGANDGMLHGFDANTLKEVFAFIPNSVIAKLKDFSSPTYTHDFFVDETPLIADVPLSGNWTTQLIGFPGVGGTGLFALNISSPDTFRTNINLSQAQTNASNIVLWELNGQTDADIGYILNRGQINQIRGGLSRQVGRLSNNRWAVITGNGYNSANNSTGLLISYLDASGGAPSYKKIMIAGETGGLSTPTTVDVDNDGIIDYAYAGDLKGNVWRFDLRNAENTWSAFKLYTPNSDWALTPITTAPTITYHCSKPGLMVIVGTGKYLEAGDNNAGYADGHNDLLMGLWDKLDTTPITTNNLIQQWYYASGDVHNASNNAPVIAQSLILTSDNPVDWSTQRGWFLPLYNNPPRPARILVPPYTMNGMVYFNTTTPDFTACENGKLWATSQALNACTGGRPQYTVFDTNFDGKITDDDKYDQWGSGTKINVTGINLQDQGRIYDASVWISPKQFACATPPCDVSTGLSDSIGVNLFQTVPKRVSWKELNSFQ